MSVKPAKAIEVFFSYSHKDEELRNELKKHLSILKRQGVITGWHDRRIGAGKEWEGEIDAHLNTAYIILLLISSDFLASDYCYDVEMKRAMERHEAGEARVIPIILRSCDWRGAPFGKLQALPKDTKPVTSWTNQDEAFTDVARGIRAAVEDLAGLSVGPPSPTGTVPVDSIDIEYTFPTPLARLLLKLVEVAVQDEVVSLSYSEQPNEEEYGAFDLIIRCHSKGGDVIVSRLRGNPIASLERLGFIERLSENKIFLHPAAFKRAEYERKNWLGSGKMTRTRTVTFTDGKRVSVPTRPTSYVYELKYSVVDTVFVGDPEELSRTKHGSIVVGITMPLATAWGLSDEGSREKVLFEHAKQYIQNKVFDNTLCEREELQLTSSTAPQECPFDPKHIKISFNRPFEFRVADELETTKSTINRDTTPAIQSSLDARKEFILSNIKQLLSDGFNDLELRDDLRLELSEFRPVFQYIAQNASKAELIAKLIDWAEQKLLMDVLLEWARKRNPAMYAEHQPYCVNKFHLI